MIKGASSCIGRKGSDTRESWIIQYRRLSVGIALLSGSCGSIQESTIELLDPLLPRVMTWKQRCIFSMLVLQQATPFVTRSNLLLGQSFDLPSGLLDEATRPSLSHVLLPTFTFHLKVGSDRFTAAIGFIVGNLASPFSTLGQPTLKLIPLIFFSASKSRSQVDSGLCCSNAQKNNCDPRRWLKQVDC